MKDAELHGFQVLPMVGVAGPLNWKVIGFDDDGSQHVAVGGGAKYLSFKGAQNVRQACRQDRAEEVAKWIVECWT